MRATSTAFGDRGANQAMGFLLGSQEIEKRVRAFVHTAGGSSQTILSPPMCISSRSVAAPQFEPFPGALAEWVGGKIRVY